MEILFKFIKSVRAITMRTIRTRKDYMSSNSLKPISTKYGFDRGIPVDRYYIEKFLEDNLSLIRGKCLEIVDNTYTLKFGRKNVIVSDILDIFPTKKANIHGDLRNLSNCIKDNTYDCIILTQTLNVVDDFLSAIKECYRILKPGGALLVTLPTISPAWNLKINLWRFTVDSAKYVFSKVFQERNVDVWGMGNRVVAKCFWLGMAVEDMTQEEMSINDSNFPLIITIKAVK